MKTLSTIGLSIALLAMNQNVSAHGDTTCNVPKEEWQPRVALQKQLQSQGWTVRNIKIENGCYEVYGFDEKNKKVEVFFNPKTFERFN